jgi:iron complex outermembrane recepter protein
MAKRWISRSASLCAASASLAGLPLQAAEPTDSAGAVIVEEIIVTAQKREQSLQDVPISIRALSEKELGRLGANGLQDFAGFAPSLSMIGQGPIRAQVTIRGVSTGDLRFDRAQIRETVGLYLDETPISTQVVSPDLGLLDIERIEVLRGPQGTLYGAGSLSGTVRLITRKPNLQEMETRGDATVLNTAKGTTGYGLSSVINVPLSTDVAGFRLAVSHRDEGGYIDNLTTGRDDINDLQQTGARASLRVLPNDRLTLDASLVHQKTELGGDFSYRAEAGDLNELTPSEEPSESKVLLPSLVVSYDFDSVVLTSATSFFRKDTSFRLNSGGFAPLLVGGPTTIDGDVVTQFEQREISQEIRLASNALDGWSYTVGAFYQDQDNGFGQDLTFSGIDAALGLSGPDFGAAPDQVYVSDISLRTRQYSLFGEVSFELTERLAATVGGRAFRVEQDSDVWFAGLLAVPRVGTEHFALEEDGFNPKVNLTYRLSDDALVYAQAAKGFRLGGTNEPVPEAQCSGDLADLGFTRAPRSFESDSLWNYEAGAKTALLDGRLTLNGAAYVIDWKRPPLGVDLLCGFSTIVNAGAFGIAGAEVDLEARPVSGLTLRAGGAYNRGELDGDLPPLGGQDGDRIPMTARLTYNASVDYEFPLPVGGGSVEGFVHLDYRYTGDRVTLFPANPSYVGYYKLPAYDLVGVRGGVAWDHWSVELFVDNVLDERAELNRTDFYRGFDTIPGTAIVSNRPRTYGLKVAFAY